MLTRPDEKEDFDTYSLLNNVPGSSTLNQTTIDETNVVQEYETYQSVSWMYWKGYLAATSISHDYYSGILKIRSVYDEINDDKEDIILKQEIEALDGEFEFYLNLDLEKYSGKWIAILDNKVIVVGHSFKTVYEKASALYPNETPLFDYIHKYRTRISK